MGVAKQSFAIYTALMLMSNGADAVDKPQTMEEMWQIIEAQQVQLDAMKKTLEAFQAAKVELSEKGHAQSLTNAELKELEHKTDALTQVVETMRTSLVIPEAKELKSAYGLGPAASKVYQVDQGLSIGGYGEVNFQTFVGDKGPKDKNNADMERLVLYVGYKFTDSIIFNSEIEFEHASTDAASNNGSVSVELAAMDFLLDPMFNIRAGVVLLPMGFINQIHEPPFYFGNNRPEVERVIIPSTWREVGAGIFGEIIPDLSYTMYAVSGLRADKFSSSGIRSGRQQASVALNEDMAFVGRIDYAPSWLPGLTIGTSAYLGNSGQGEVDADVFTQLYEAHVEWKYRGWEFRTLGSWGHIGDAAIVSAHNGTTVGSSNYGVYTEIGYDVMPLIMPDTIQYLAPFFRYEKLDTLATVADGYLDDLSEEQDIFQVGFNYKPIPQVVIKADYRNRNTKAGTKPDEFNIGFGFIF
ncbi:MAG: hypothetical protein IBX55_04930 [Methyloprofundus sp.]|nr:hypothetical protein [Methyloprofundus sp.]